MSERRRESRDGRPRVEAVVVSSEARAAGVRGVRSEQGSELDKRRGPIGRRWRRRWRHPAR